MNGDQDQTTGAAETFGVASPDPWMQGRIAAERGDTRGEPPCWLIPDDQKQWRDGWASCPPAGWQA